jgi:hypothetical protein
MLNTETAKDVLDTDDWSSLGKQYASCCLRSYTVDTRPGDPLRTTDFDMDSIASFSAQVYASYH